MRRACTAIARGVVAAGAFVFALGSAIAQEPVKPRYTSWWLPDQRATAAGPIDDIFYIILWVTSIVFAGVFVAFVYFLIKYRYKQGRRATYSHGNNKLEITWTAIPAILLIGLAVVSDQVWSDIKKEVPAESSALVIEVRPRQFQWDVTYSGADGKFGTPDDLEMINQMHVPVNQDVIVKMTAQDVIHSFFVPEFRMKQDAVPGMRTEMWFKATEPGVLDIACAELCGLGHYKMKGVLTVDTPEAYKAWYDEQLAKKAKQLAPPPAAAATPPASGAPSADTATAPAATADTAASSTASGDTASN